MSVAIAKVLKANGMSTFQDVGRKGAMQEGVTESGMMDIHAGFWANKLLGRPATSPVIEITLGMFELEILHDCRIAITGADLQAKRNQQALMPWQTWNLQSGDTLAFQFPQSGLRAYLAFDVTHKMPDYFDSVSTVVQEQSGGLGQGALKVGDVLHATEISRVKKTVKMPDQFIPDYNPNQVLTLDVIPSYQFSQFSDKAKETFIDAEYQIDTKSTRIAYLLKGEPIKHNQTQLTSEGIAYGAIQIPVDGQPVILLNDRQTMGGYPKIGCISRLSGARLAQAFAPQTLRFRFVERASMLQKWREFNAFFRR